MSVGGAQHQIASLVGDWDGVQVAPHRFGGVEFAVGRREIGHVHGDSLVDIPFPRKVRDVLVRAGRAEPHHILPDSGWVSVYLHDDADVQRAIALLRQSYDLALAQRGKKPRDYPEEAQ